MTRAKACLGTLAWLTACAAAPPSMADVVIGNLSAPTGGSTIFGESSNTVYKAFGFTMGDDAFFLDNVLLTMVFNPGANPVVSIWSGDSLPETELIVLDNPPDLPGEVGDYAFTPPSRFVLEANETYWVHVRSEPLDGPDFLWIATDPPAVPMGMAEAVGYIFNGNPSSFMNRLQVNGTLVPAPAALGLIGTGAAAFGRRRRRA